MIGLKTKLNIVVEKLNADSAKFWADKPKLSHAELSAIETFAKKKDKVFESFFSSKDNINKLDSLFKAAIKTKKAI